MGTFSYTYPAFNGETDTSNYAANLNYMLSTDARAFALNSMVHSDGANHPSRSGANLYEFYASGTKVIAASVYDRPSAGGWTMVSNPAGDPTLYSPDTSFINIATTGLWLLGGICTSSVNQTELGFWYFNTTNGNRDSKLAGDTTLFSPHVALLKAPMVLTMFAYSTVAATITFKMYGLRVATQ